MTALPAASLTAESSAEKLHGIRALIDGVGAANYTQRLTVVVMSEFGRRVADMLAEDWGVSAGVWSVTSWYELRREALKADDHNFLHPEEVAALGGPGAFVTAWLEEEAETPEWRAAEAKHRQLDLFS